MDGFSEFAEWLSRAWAYLTTGRVLATVLGFGFAILAISLWIASRTKWGQTKPLTKCVVVSVMLHVWLLMYAIGTPRILPQGDLDAPEQNISVSFDPVPHEVSQAMIPAESSVSSDTPDETSTSEDELTASENEPELWESVVPLDDLPKPPEFDQFDLAVTKAPSLLPAIEPTPLPALPPLEDVVDESQPDAASTEAESHDSSAEMSSPQFVEQTTASDAPSETMAVEVSSQHEPSSQTVDRPAQETVATGTNQTTTTSQLVSNPSVAPEEYKLREAANRLDLSQAFGADADSEAAVEAALAWLASAQAEDGSWVAAHHGAGEERFVLGETRHGTGGKADTGVSGLALLAFLSAGHTHLTGDYKSTVQKGLQFLLRVQMPSGDLSGPKQVGSDWSVLNARMYCHGIAMLALAEAHAMTRDVILRQALLRAAQYSINAQDVRGGGWRYRPRDPGDLSQFGWQAMALKSVERSGIQIPVEVRRRMRRFLDSCAAGEFGGLATYRPKEGLPSDTMTAEALTCRLMLGYPQSLAAQQGALGLIMSHQPGSSEANVYYWYYATLALFQLQDENW